MNRRDLLKRLGAIGVGSLFLPKVTKAAGVGNKQQSGVCWLTTSLTEGPFYFNPGLVRQDIRTDSDTGAFHDGLQLNMNISVIDIDCNPIPNVLVDVWHTDATGLYSGYVQPNGSTVGEDFMRGIQMTDANGQCSFITSYPGWYPGRATHVHFKVRLDAFTYVTSQFAFPDSANNAVYATPIYAGRGANPTTNASDGIFGNRNLEHLIMEVVPSSATGGYDGTFTIGIDAPTGIKQGETNPEGYGLKQNYPNPFNPGTKIEYHLPVSSEVDLRVYDALGKEVRTLVSEKQSAGTHEVSFEAQSLGSGFYFYRLVAGNYAQTREMLLIR